MPSIHKAVLLHEVVKALGLQVESRNRELEKPTGDALGHRAVDQKFIYLDGTLGGAGHALAIANAFNGQLTIIGLDRDPMAIERAEESLKGLPAMPAHAGQAGKAEKIILENEDFRNLDKVLEKNEIKEVDFILLDLGLSSDELEHSGRGFSFQKDEPLLMTFGQPAQHPFTALSIVNGWKEEDIANVIYAYGEERYARKIAKGIVAYRDKKPIQTSGELAELVKVSVPFAYRRGKIHPATRTFQALRIAVNDELGALRSALPKAWAALAKNGRLAVISFHSLEDRIVKEFMKEKSKKGKGETAQGILLNKKPITAGAEEISENPRSRSAKLRIIEKI